MTSVEEVIAPLLDLLACFVSPDNSARRHAEIQFSERKESDPRGVIIGLVTIVAEQELYRHLFRSCRVPHESVRALAAVLLRGIAIREQGLWTVLSSTEAEEARRMLLFTLMAETNSLNIRRKIADAIAAVAKLSPWPELLQTVQQLSMSERSCDHQLCMYLLNKLAEHIGRDLVAAGSQEVVLSMLQPRLLGGGGTTGDDALISAGAAAEALCSLLTDAPELPSKQWSEGLATCFDIARTLALNDATCDDQACGCMGALLKLAEECPGHFQDCIQGVLEKTLTVVASKPTDINADFDSGTHARSLAVQLGTELLMHPLCGSKIDAVERKGFLDAVMNACMGIDATDEGTNDFLQSAEDEGEGDVANDSTCGHLAAEACASLERLSQHLEPQEIMQICIQGAWKLTDHPDWTHRRVAMVVTAITVEGARSLVYPLLSELVPRILARVKDEHPRVRYVALHCIIQLISEFRGGDSDGDDDWSSSSGEDDDDDSSIVSDPRVAASEESFQMLFKESVPPALYSCLLSEINCGDGKTNRVAFLAMKALRLFYDPDACTNESCDSQLLSQVLDRCKELLQAFGSQVQPPWYLMQEAASLIGNAGLMIASPILLMHLDSLLSILNAGIGDLTAPLTSSMNSDGQELAYTIYRCRCLEATALLARAAGKPAFEGHAHNLLGQLMVAINLGLDFTNPLSSYICQTCARFAGVLEEGFAPYMPVVLPVLISYIAEPVRVDIAPAEEISKENAYGGEHTFEIYKRGQGLLRVSCSTDELRDKVMAARILYQYCLDVPQFMPPYALLAVRALCKLSGTIAFDEECAMVVGAAHVELLRLHCYYPEITENGEIRADAVTNAANIANEALSGLLDALEHVQALIQARSGAGSGLKSYEERANHIVDSIRELLKLMYSLRCRHVRQWPADLRFQSALAVRAVSMCGNELVLWIDKYAVKDAGGAGVSRDEYITLRDSRRDGPLDSLGWLLRLSDEDSLLEIQNSYMETVLPLLLGVLTSGLDPAVASPILLIPILGLLDAVQYIPAARNEVCRSLHEVLINVWNLGDGTMTISCIYGLGICMSYGQPSLELAGATVKALVSVLGLDPDSTPVELNLDDDAQEALLRDNALASLLRTSVYQAQLLGPDMSTQMLRLALSGLPLQDDQTEGQELHALLMHLLETHDKRLVGENWSLLPDVFRAVAAMQIRVGNSYKKLNNAEGRSGKDLCELDEFWESQNVLFDTFQKGCMAVKVLAAGNCPPSVKDELAASLATFTKKQQRRLLTLGY